jgi:protein SCO1/2
MLVLAAFLSGLVLFFGAILFISGRAPSPIGSAVAAVGGPFHLEDQNGRPVTDQDMKGRPFLVFFGFTHCPDICPTTLFDISQVLRELGPDADRAGALFITVDPDRDTPAVIKNYLSNFDPHLRGLTGDQASINAAIKAYRVYAKKIPLEGGDYTMDHTAVVYLMDKDGQFVAPFDVSRPPEAAAADLRRYL